MLWAIKRTITFFLTPKTYVKSVTNGLEKCFLNTAYGYLRSYPGIENFMLPMLPYPGSLF